LRWAIVPSLDKPINLPYNTQNQRRILESL